MVFSRSPHKKNVWAEPRRVEPGSVETCLVKLANSTFPHGSQNEVRWSRGAGTRFVRQMVCAASVQ